MEQVFRALRKLGLMNLARRSWCTFHSRKRGMKLFFRPRVIEVRRGQDEIWIGRDHEVYLNDAITFFDYYFSAVVPEEQHGRRIADYSQPRVHRLRRSLVEFEFPSLPESDESTETYLATLQLQEGETVFDLGAYAGGSTYFFSKAVGSKGMVAAFEPDPVNQQFLRANVQRHGLANVIISDCGIWSENTTLAFQSEGNMGSSVSAVLKRNSNVRQTQVITLDEASRLLGDRCVSCIKMDIEGAEVEVLQGAGEFLRRHRSRLVIEPHRIEGQMTTEKVTEILRGFGYHVELLSQGSQNWPLIAARLV